MPFDPSTLTFNEAGLLPAVAQDAATGEVLMLAWMNAEAVRRTLETGRVTYWSRSRQSFWVKGETSGHVQDLVEMRVDCDGDALLIKVRQTGPACHTGARSCFFTKVHGGEMVADEAAGRR
ncbi:MAG: Phosphoribosyl-AMP cyclohydrolase [uncultured Rubellimicrobium sp.]|uniref:Phosphoribosyl-AMP cyclohydrolase n=1 Tax=uncultured Rubellimicrobium sp. TaxID=543078 RepID=A0A6J4P1G3_9RHOB|nr:MAG: Phosphoribosyl-AMP cyclohydrolase [uncultured Rubellimicrobium sp.]